MLSLFQRFRTHSAFIPLLARSARVFVALCILIGGTVAMSQAKSLTAPIIPVLDTRQEQVRLEQEKNAESRANETSEQRLERLFVELRKTSNEAAAKRVAGQIQTVWNRSGSATVDLLMQWSNTAMLEKKYDVAIDFLDEALVLKPDYAEVWSRRAMLHMMKEQPNRALFDVHKALELEPRHFSAMIILGTLMESRGLKERAMQVYGQALEIYPMMRDIQSSYVRLVDELSDIRT